MTDPAAPFDLAALSRAINEQRTTRGLSWAELSRSVGVSPGTIRRFATASDAEADGVLALVRWLDLPPEHFVPDSTIAGSPLPACVGGAHNVVRVDMMRVAELPSWTRSARPGGRTTVQALVSAVQASGATVASLTHLSPF